jgi:CheY-like chemotaxis protein
MRVLVVEDQPDLAAILMRLLRRIGHFPVLATTGRDAISTSVWARPHLVLMDIELPDLNGFEVARQLRTQNDLRDVPVWAVTSSPDDARKRVAAGIIGYMQKPISLDKLKRAFKTLRARRGHSKSN